MGRSRECEEWFNELARDLGVNVDQESHYIYYELVIAARRLALWALTNPNLEPDLKDTAHNVMGSALGADPDDDKLQALVERLDDTKRLVGRNL